MAGSNRVILLADNDPDFLNVRAEFLQDAGYRVLKAQSPEQARQHLADTHIHLVVLDVRLVNDDDERDTSGLTLAAEPAYRAVPKIVLTGFPAYQHTRKALSLVDGFPPAVEFLAKEEGPEFMVQTVNSVFDQHVRINENLQIHWNELVSCSNLAAMLHRDLPGEIPDHAGDELEDLFRQLFYDCHQLLIDRLIWHDSGRLCISVLARSVQGATDGQVLVCGEREHVTLAQRQVGRLAPQGIQGIKLVGTAETVHFCAATYVCPQADVETMQPLEDLFQTTRERPLKAALGHLLTQVLPAWHGRGQEVSTDDLMMLYRKCTGLTEDDFPHTEVERRVRALVQAVRPLVTPVEIKYGGETMVFHFPNQSPLTHPDPVATVYAPLTQDSASVICRISPGQLTADNILVDSEQHTWLTDYAYAGQAPQWWDFVCLEAIIRFDLSQAPDLMAWQEFEECLLAPAWLHDRLREQDVIADLRTSITLIEEIRRQAGSEAGSDPLPYYAGLLTWVVEAMARYDPEVLHTKKDRARGAHMLLAAAMLAGRLSEPISSPNVEGELHLDDEGSAWIGERHVATLMGQELDLLRNLFVHARENRLMSRKVIVESVFRESYVAGDKYQEGRINSLIRRLRVKIEPDPKRPRYILTAKGKGYRLAKE